MNQEELEKRLNWYESRYGPYIEKRGPQNFKNLFRKPNSYEWTILFMLVLVIISAFGYSYETQACRETLENLPLICSNFKFQQNQEYLPVIPNTLANLTNISYSQGGIQMLNSTNKTS